VSVLFAGWIDRSTDATEEHARADRWTGFIPSAVVAGLAVWAVVAPRNLITSLTSGSGSGSPAEIHAVREATLIALGFCLAAGIVVWVRSVLGLRPWLIVASLFMAADLGLVGSTSQLALPPPNAVLAGNTAVEADVALHLAPGGRFDVYDPLQYSNGQIALTGLPDDNVLARLPSVGGYGSIVSGNYNAQTLTHSPGDLNVSRLGTDYFDQLGLQVIVTAPEYFLLALSSAPDSLDDVHQVSEYPGEDPVLPLAIQADYVDRGYGFYPAPRGRLLTGQESTWFFGESVAPTRASVVLGSAAGGGRIRFGALETNGSTRWGHPVAVPPGATHVTGALPPGNAIGLVVQVIAGRLPPHQAVVLVGGRTYEVDGSLSSAVRPPAWRELRSVDGYSMFVRAHPPTPLYAIAAPGSRAPRIRVLSSNPNAETIRLRAKGPVVVVRDVAWDAGWHASVSSDHGPSQPLAVRQRGLVQQVRLPIGTDVVTFDYRPRHWLVASALSEVSSLFLAILGVVTLLRRRAGRRAR
jgi:hypothetical protein